jgi:hypothetical protein
LCAVTSAEPKAGSNPRGSRLIPIPFYLMVAMALASDKIGQDAMITIIPKAASSAK